jgi:hypothetical protein
MKLIAGSLSDLERMQECRSAVACLTVLAAVITCRAGEAEQATYDQRQNGDLNIHVQVHDVGILALLDESLFSGGYGVSKCTVSHLYALRRSAVASSSIIKAKYSAGDLEVVRSLVQGILADI